MIIRRERQEIQEEGKHKSRITAKDLCIMGIMVAIIEVCKTFLSVLPNIELTTFWIIMFTLFWGRKVAYVVPAFILLEGCIYGFGTWWIMYLYAWPLLVFVTWLFRKQESVWFWSMLSAMFGFSFGLLCSLVYFVIGLSQGDVFAGFTWWVAGIPMDMIHGIGNFVLMLVLYKPIGSLLGRLKKWIL